MHVVLFAAQSLDGCITRHEEAGDAFASDADKMHFRAALRACDACVMGRATYEQSKERMRPQAFPGLRRVIWTRTPETWAAETIPDVLEFSGASPREITDTLRNAGRRRCAILGGGSVNAAWLAAGLVDEVCVTVESRIFGFGTALAGGGGGEPGGGRCSGSALDVRLALIEARTLAEGGPMLLRYAVER